MRSKLSLLHVASLPSTLLCGSLLLGCGGATTPEATISPSSVLINNSTHPLTSLSGALITPKVLRGTYGATCKVHGGQNWDLTLNDPTDRSLEVVLNDSFANCPLKVTGIQVQVGNQLSDYVLPTPITLGLAYAPTPAAVNQPTPMSLAFYTNAKFNGLAGVTYTNDFYINMVYSDDAQACTSAPPATYAKVTAAATGSNVPPPNYTMAFDALQLKVDANQIVQNSSSGNVVLKFPAMGGQIGEQWRLYDEASLCCDTYSFAAIDTIYRNVTPVSSGNITAPGDISIPWTNWDLAGKALPKSRWLIVKHTDLGAGGVYSYEMFQVVFPGAS